MAYIADGGLVRHDLRNLGETSCHPQIRTGYATQPT